MHRTRGGCNKVWCSVRSVFNYAVSRYLNSIGSAHTDLHAVHRPPSTQHRSHVTSQSASQAFHPFTEKGTQTYWIESVILSKIKSFCSTENLIANASVTKLW